MIKCGINRDTLKSIKQDVDQLVQNYRADQHSNLNAFKQTVNSYINSIKDKYEQDDVDLLATHIARGLRDFKNDSFFDIPAIKSALTYVANGSLLDVNTEAGTHNILKNKETIQDEKLVNDEFLTDAYGSAKNVRRQAEIQAKTSIVDACFINRGSIEGRTGVVTKEELNRNMRQYQQQLLNKICEFLKTKKGLPKNIVDIINNPQLYEVIDGKAVNTNILLELQSYMDMYLDPQKNYSNSALIKLSKDAQTHNDPTRRKEAQLELAAFNAYVFFKHFDEYIKIIFPKAIQIKSTEFGKKSGSDDTYSILKTTAQTNTTWRTSDDIDENELDAITRAIIETSQIYAWDSNTPKPNEYLTFQHYQNIIGKIKALGNNVLVRSIKFDKNFERTTIWKSLSSQTKNYLKGKNLGEAINMIKQNDRANTHAIFEILANPEFKETYNEKIYQQSKLVNGFTKTELSHLWSIYKNIYDPKSDSSIRSLVKNNPSVDYYGFITQTTNSIYQNIFIQYTTDEDGNLVTKLLTDMQKYQQRIKLNTNINTYAYAQLIHQLDQYSCNKQNKLVTYNIPNTDIKVTVNINSGNCLYTNSQGSINDFSKLFTDDTILKFINDILGIPTDVEFLTTMGINKSFTINRLLNLSSNIIANTYIYSTELEGLSLEDTSVVKDGKTVKIQGIKSKYEEIYNKKGTFNKRIQRIDLISNDKSSRGTLEAIVEAQFIYQGLATSTQVKDSQKANQNLLSLSKLLGGYGAQWDLQERNKWIENKDGTVSGSVTSGLSLLNIDGLFIDHYNTREYYNRQTHKNKDATKFKINEAAYINIMSNFVQAFEDNGDNLIGNGSASFLASVNSDKNTIGQLLFNLHTFININGQSKRIIDLTTLELYQIISQDFGTMYCRILDSINSDFYKLQNHIKSKYSDFPNIVTVAFTVGEQKIPKFKLSFDELNKWCANKKLKASDFISEQIENYNQTHRFNPIELVDQTHYKTKGNNLIVNNVLYSQIARFNPNEATRRGINTNFYYTIDEFFKLKNIEIIKSLLESNTTFNLLEKAQEVPNNKTSQAIIKRKFPSWVNTSGKMIIAKCTFGQNSENIVSKYDIKKLAKKYNIKEQEIYNYITQINPLLEQYNLLDYWFTQQWMNVTVGSFIGHPGKKADGNAKDILNRIKTISKEVSDINKSINESNVLLQTYITNGVEENLINTVRQTINGLNNKKLNLIQERNNLSKEYAIYQEAACYQDQHKRNVSFTAQMYAFSLNTLQGIPETYNIAVIRDITKIVSILESSGQKIKPYDGATFVNAFINYLENNSLGGNRAGTDKKQFVHFKNERTGIGGIIKTAGFAITNDRIRRSPNGWGNMHKQTSDHVWLNEDGTKIDIRNIDLTKSFNGIDLVKTLGTMYFAKNGQQYAIVKWLRNNDGTYTRVIAKVTPTGTIGDVLTNEELSSLNIEHTMAIDSNYKLWKFFGGEYSLKMGQRVLQPSETSIENVVTIMNNVGILKTDIQNVETQNDIWQFMKHADIHYMPTEGAVKQGAANINSNKKYNTDSYLDHQRIKMYQAGIQLDKEHHADDSEVSLPTQIVSACASLGYTFNQATQLYKSLAAAANIGIKTLVDAYNLDYTENDITKLREEVFKLISENLANSSSANQSFASIIAKAIVKRVRNNKNEKYGEGENIIPLSDKTIFNKMLSTISSYINKSSIKLKLPGILAVISPSEGLYKIYRDANGNIKTYDSFVNPDQELLELQKNAENNPIFLSSSQNESFLQSNVNEFDEDAVDNSLVEVVKMDKPWKNDPSKSNKTLRFYLKGQPSKGYFELVKDNEYGYYSIHLKTNNGKFGENVSPSTSEERAILYQQLINAIPDGARVSTWGELSPGGIYALNKIGKHFIKVDKRQVKDKEGNTIYIPVYQKGQLVVNQNINKIYDLKMGREYVITYSDGTTNVMSINSPTQLRRLQSDTQAGYITKIHEYVLNGSELGAYNALFNTADGQRFQLWQLDSINAIHELNEFKDNKDREIAFKNWYYATFGVETNLTFKEGVKMCSNWVQKDLMRLSKSSDDVIFQFDELIKRYNRIATEIENATSEGRNIHNLTLRAEEIKKELDELISSQLTSTFANYTEARNALVNLQSVKINGQLYLPIKESIEIEAYELIMPKTFIKEFGFDEFTDLNVVKNDEDFFIKQYIRNRNTNEGRPKPSENQFDIELLSSNGEHIFIISEEHLKNSDLKPSPYEILTKQINGKTVRIKPDVNQTELYELINGSEIYIDTNGNEVIVVKNSEKQSDIDVINKYVSNLSFDTLNFSQNLSNYGDYTEKLTNKLKNNSRRKVRDFFDKQIIQGKNFDTRSILKRFKEIHIPELTEQNYQQYADKIKHIIKAGRRKHASFLKSLEVVAGRIPSQSLQSFMPMKVVAYDNPNINSAYVSALQFLLQGSDLDIDAVTLLTYDINRSGLVELWSPYTNMETLKLLNASMKLPFPTGHEMNYEIIEKIENNEPNYERLFNMIRDLRNAIQVMETSNGLRLFFRTDTDFDLSQVKKVLEMSKYYRPSDELMEDFVQALNRRYPTQNGETLFHKMQTAEQAIQFFNELKQLIDKHNFYLNDKSIDFIQRVENNHLVSSVYDISSDIVNQRQAQAPIDEVTGPLKEIANTSKSAKDSYTRTPGSWMNKLQSIDENQQGKDCIGISAVGIKSFFALTQYANKVLNEGTSEDQARLLGNVSFKNLRGNPDDSATILANIRAKNLNSVTNRDILNLLLSAKTEEDQALVLSGLLSLSTDNAKELSLAKLNAGSTMIGTYIYGICIGMDFKNISDILMSDSVQTINEVMSENIITGDQGYARLEKVFDYFEKKPFKFLSKFNTHYTSREIIETTKKYDTPYTVFENTLKRYQIDLFKDEEWFKFITSNKFDNIMTNLRNQTHLYFQNEDVALYNQLLDFVEDYRIQYLTVNPNSETYKTFKKLSEGGQEMFVLGQMVGLNQGVPTDLKGIIKKVNLFRNAFKDKEHRKPVSSKVGQDIENFSIQGVDLQRFVNEEQYRQDVIEAYDHIKVSFNIFDVISKLDHTFAYVKDLAIVDKAASQSYKYRVIRNNVDKAMELFNATEDDVIRGLNNYIGDKLILDYQRLRYGQQNSFINLPPGNYIFNSDGLLLTTPTTESTPIQLGSDYTNATFRKWMEDKIIPDLKRGYINGKYYASIAENDFIKGLVNDIRTNTTSGNGSIVYTLRTNMLPKTDQERIELNKYISAFNELDIPYSDEYNSPKSIKDLFIMYSLIAHNGALSESSLMSLFEHQQNDGILKELHNFITAFDLNGDVLQIEALDTNILSRYIASRSGVWGTFSQNTWYFDEATNRMELASKVKGAKKENPRMNGFVKQYSLKNIDSNYFTELIVKEDNTFAGRTKDGLEIIIHQTTGLADIKNIDKLIPEGKIINDLKSTILKDIPITIWNSDKGQYELDLNLTKEIVEELKNEINKRCILI